MKSSEAVRSKIKSLDDMAAVAAAAKARGETVVLCHGVFDLLHLGHVRHLENASREGDRLFVSVTADEFVNKGPGRPVFSANLRLEMLAALEYVDCVAVNNDASAVSVLRKVKPEIYVKGKDYENPEDDITGKIEHERLEVERHGGRIVFTNDLTFSSSNLINRHLDLLDPDIRACLDRLRGSGVEERIAEMLKKIADFKVLFIGETIIDEYQFVNTLGKTPKENIIATLSVGREEFAGGVVAAANHLAEFCGSVTVATDLSGDARVIDFVTDSLRPGVNLNPFRSEHSVTTKKSRFIDRSSMRKLFEVYDMDDRPNPEAVDREIDSYIQEQAGKFDLVIVTDFGHGMLSQRNVNSLVERSKFLAVNTQSNSGNMGFNFISKYPRADFVCIDAPEARLATREKYAPIERVVAERLPKIIDCPRFIITHGSFGCYSYDLENGVDHMPAFSKDVIDTVGAGDAFFAIASPLVAAGASIRDAAFLGNLAGAMKVAIVGHRRAIDKVSLSRYMATLLK